MKRLRIRLRVARSRAKATLARWKATLEHRAPAWTRQKVSFLTEVGSMERTALAEGVLAQVLDGDRLTFSVIEIAPNVVTEHNSHEAEQVGMLVHGSGSFSIEAESHPALPGTMWRIPSNVPHGFSAGPEGAIVLDAWVPPRVWWRDLPRLEPAPARWLGGREAAAVPPQSTLGAR